jgi:sugar O-acyltransferase (sialic acid O-acetyltransferase NeuD family)
MKKDVMIFGAGGHGSVVAEVMESMGKRVHGFFDDDTIRDTCLDYPIFHDVDLFTMFYLFDWLIAVGNNSIRKQISLTLKQSFAVGIHPAAVVSKRTVIGAGSVIMPGSILNSRTIVGRHCILNTNSSVDHDCIIGDYVHIAPAAALAGSVIVGEGTEIGTGAIVIPGIKIGKWCKIGAGAVIVRDVPDGTVSVGVPGRVTRHLEFTQ